MVKVTFLGYLIYRIVLDSVPALLPMCYGTLDDVFPCLRAILKSLACYTVFGYVVIAVGVRYRPDEAPLPKVVCSGEDAVAKEIREAAVREGIPLMENVELARALYAQVKIEAFIPVELVEPVAEVLKLVKAMDDAKREDADLDAIDL